MKKKSIIITIILIIAILLIVSTIRPKQTQLAESDYETKEELLTFIADNLISGGVSKDAIPSIDNPVYITADEAHIEPSQQIYGTIITDQAYAYPQSILYWHEIVNHKTDEGKQFSVTYCPLTETTIGYLDVELGVSGKLYNSNLVTYDRKTDALIPQILGIKVTENVGEKLKTFDIVTTTFEQWVALHPDTLVLVEPTEFGRDYTRSPYPGYDQLLRLWFPVAAQSDRFSSKDIVHGVLTEKSQYVISKDFMKEQSSITYDGLTFTYNTELDIVDVTGKVTHFDAYWFAWYAYYPKTIILDDLV